MRCTEYLSRCFVRIELTTFPIPWTDLLPSVLPLGRESDLTTRTTQPKITLNHHQFVSSLFGMRLLDGLSPPPQQVVWTGALRS